MTAPLPERKVVVDRGDGCWRGRFHAMASPCEVLCKTNTAGQAQDLTELAATEVWRIEDKFSRYRDDNIIARINSADGKTVDVDSETAQLVDFSATLFELSNGKFDITSGVLRKVWCFDGGSEIPSQKSVQEVLNLVGWHKADWSDQQLRIESGMEIDFGGIGKEYAVDRASTILRGESEVSCLVNLGGDLAVTRRANDRQPWTVGIESQSTTTEMPASLLKLQVGAIATSGDARRYLIKDGIRYSHILDARNGWPVADAPRSITVAADTCTQAGMLSTLSMLEGDAAEVFLEEQGVDYWCER
jgi:thiamine biosynthesis lipoprotein